MHDERGYNACMSAAEATAEVFWTAFQAMSEEERGKFITRVALDRELMEDLIDIATADDRKDESSRPIEDFLAALEAEDRG